jgi:hypothetical protein
MNVLLVIFLNLLAANEAITDVAQLAKGRVLYSFIRQGMTIDEVIKFLGPPGFICGGFCPFASYEEYGITVHYSNIGFFDSTKKPDPPRVISVEFSVPEEYQWENLWPLGKSNEREQHPPEGTSDRMFKESKGDIVIE